MPIPQAHTAVAPAADVRPAAAGNPRQGYAVHDSEGTIQPRTGCLCPGAPCEVAEL
jgi:hypothetical protein